MRPVRVPSATYRIQFTPGFRFDDARRLVPYLCGDYVPLDAVGPQRDHVCAFARRLGGLWVIVAVPRLVARLQAEGGRGVTGTCGHQGTGGGIPAHCCWLAGQGLEPQPQPQPEP
ncbi:MAG: hypothetical protein GX492_10205 [Firmicutes bacterium]|nr:hypothetical protein [Bacillota bacterium]